MIHCFNKNDKAIQNIIAKRGEEFLLVLSSQYSGVMTREPLLLELTEHYRDRDKALSAYIDSYKDEFEAQYDTKDLDRYGRPSLEVITKLVDASKSEQQEDKERTVVMSGLSPSIVGVTTARLASAPVAVRKSGGSIRIAVHDLINPLKEFAHTIVSLNTYGSSVHQLRELVRTLEGSKVVREDVADVSESYNLMKYLGDAIAAGDNVFAPNTKQYNDWKKVRDTFIQKAAYDLTMSIEALDTVSTSYASDILNDFNTEGSKINSFRLTTTDGKDIDVIVDKFLTKIRSMRNQFAVAVSDSEGLYMDAAFKKSHKKAAKIIEDMIDELPTTDSDSEIARVIYLTARLNSHSAGVNRAVQDALDKARLTGKTPPLDDFLRIKNNLVIYNTTNLIDEMMKESSELHDLFTEAGLVQKIGFIRSNKASIEHNIKELAKLYMVNTYSPYLERVEYKHRVDLESKFKSENVGISKEDLTIMVDAQMEKDKALITKKKRDTLSKMTDFMMFDINSAEALFLDPRSTNNEFMQIFTERMDKKDQLVRNETIDVANEVSEAFSAMKKDNPNKTVSELFRPMLDRKVKVNSDGTIAIDNNGDVIFTEEVNSRYVSKFPHDLEARVQLLEAESSIDAIAEVRNAKELAALSYITPQGERRLHEKFASKQYAELTSGKDSTSVLFQTLIKVNALADSSLPKALRLGDKIPRLERSAKQAKQDSGLLEASKEEIKNFWEVRGSDELQMEHATDPLTGGSIPVFFRQDMDESKISHDLATSAVLNYNTSRNYFHKQGLRAESAFLLDMIGEARVGKKSLFSGQSMKIDRRSEGRYIRSEQDLEVDEIAIENKKDGSAKAYKIATLSGRESNIYRSLKTQIEQRLYNLTSTSSPEVTKRVKAAATAVSKVYLLGNLPGATKNFIMGNINNLLLAINSKHITQASLAKANAQYAANLHNYIIDLESIRPRSLHGQLFEKLNVFQGFRAVDGTNYADRDFFSKAYGNSYANFLYSGGEHHISSTLALAVLNSYKVEDSEGKQVPIIEAYQLNDKGKLEVKDGYKVSPDQEFEVERIIENGRRYAQGNYSTTNRTAAQQGLVTSLAEQMRKFLAPSLKSRYRGIGNVLRREEIDIDSALGFYNSTTGEYEEGSYVSAIRLVRGVVSDLVRFKFNMVSGRYNNLTDHQKRNVARAMLEASIMIVASIGAAMLHKLAVDEEDEEERSRLFFYTYMLAGIKSELLFYVNPSEATKLMKSPGVALPLIDNVIRLAGQIFSPTEEFTRGSHTGEIKALYYLKNTLPFRYGIPYVYEGAKSIEESTQAMFRR